MAKDNGPRTSQASMLQEALENAFGTEYLDKVRVYAQSKPVANAPQKPKLPPTPASENRRLQAPRMAQSKRNLATPNTPPPTKAGVSPTKRKSEPNATNATRKLSPPKAGKTQKRKAKPKRIHEASFKSAAPLPGGKPNLSKHQLAGRASNEGARLRFNQLKSAAAQFEPQATQQLLEQCSLDQLKLEWTNLIGKLIHFSEAERHLCTVLIKKLSRVETEWARRLALRKGDAGYFKWPTTKVVHGRGQLGTGGWVEKGMLGYLGYHVGKTSELKPEQRRRLLDHIFYMSLPPLESSSYMADWSLKATPERLRKMAVCIANFTQQAKRQRNPAMATAIRDWEADLSYLRHRYYIGIFPFAWPSTAI